VRIALGRALATAALTLGGPAAGGEELRFEDCIPAAGETPAVTVEYAGKTYGLRSEPCRVEFQSDPERYSQLYEALTELARTGTTAPDPGSVSLVPS
jgi:YHS domain-containing protein